MDAGRTEVATVASAARAFLEPRWRAWKAVRTPWALEDPRLPLAHSMCRFSALFLARVLQAELGGAWWVDGGCDDPAHWVDPAEVDPARAPGGMRGADDRWHGHFWAVGGAPPDPDAPWLVDVTADQFGGPSVLVTTTADPRYRGNYRPCAVEDHLRHVSARCAAWLEDWDRERAPAERRRFS